jgi:hypothetical protein
MTRTVLLGGGVLAALLTAGLVPAQQPPGSERGKPQAAAKDDKAAAKDKEPTLEEMLAEALKDNPDIRVAEAKRQEADAVLNKTRLQVMQQVVALNAARKEAQAGVAQAERDLARLQRLQGANNLASAEEVQKAETALLAAKAALEKADADLALVLGRHTIKGVHAVAFSPDGRQLSTVDFDGTVRSMAEKLRKALDTPVKVDYKDVPFTDVLKDLEKRVPGITFHNQMVHYAKEGNPPITLRFNEPLPLRAALQALEDDFQPFSGRIAFVVREYGILVTPQQFLPPGAVQVDDFGRGEPPGDKPKAPGPSGAKNPPPEPIEGTIKEVDLAAGLMTVSVGSDSGLARGHTLEVYRLNPPKYLGTLRIIEVKPREAVGKMEGRKLAEVQVSDLVTSKIIDK